MPRLEEERSLAARVAGSANLQDVRLFGAAAHLERPVFNGSLSYSLSSDISVQAVGEPTGSVVVTGDYKVTVTRSEALDSDDEDEMDPEVIGELSFTLAALFTIATQPEGIEPFEEEEYEAFGGTTGQFALYPYAREFISDMTGRMGLPPLHIGTLQLQLDSRTGD